MSALDALPIDDTINTLRRFWRWWFGELVAAIPARLRTLLSPRRTKIEIAVDRGEAIITRVRNGLSEEIGRYGTDTVADERIDPRPADGAVTVARLPSEHVLRKRLSLPYASERTLRALLKHEVARHSPLDLEAVRWTFQITARDKARNRSQVELHIVKRDTMETTLRVCQAIGLTPHRIEFGAPGSAAASFDVAKRFVFRPRTIWRQHGIALLSALVAALVALNLAHEYTLRTAQARTLAADVKRLKPETEAVRSLREQIAAIENGMRATATRKRGATLQTLSDITGLLPDDTWAFDFQTDKDGIALRGFSAEAAGLIGLLDKSTLLHDAQFQAPLTKAGPEGKDRFDLSAKFRSVP